MAYSFASSYNVKKLFDIDTSDFEYHKLEELFEENSVENPELGTVCDKIFPVRGVYINSKSMFDPQPTIATDDCYVNFPAHMYQAAVDILRDPRAISAINSGKVGFKIEKYYQKRFQKDCYTATWVDM